MFLNVPASAFLVSTLVSVLIATSSSVRNTQYDTRRLARQTSCQRLQYRCDNGECIPSYNVCDGAKDCSDGSDETRSACRASGIKCPSLAFECSYGACIDRELRCNGQSDCADGSDEVGCNNPTPANGNSCGVTKFKCLNGQCINTWDACDGVKNCDDGSDETKEKCKDFMCPASSFQCDYGACLELSVKCDGKSDCPDDSDELNCRHNNTTNRPLSNVPLKGGCSLPGHPKHGAYSSLDCSPNDPRIVCRNIPGTLVDNGWVIKYTCNSEYSLNETLGFSICENGNWNNALDCIKLCPPLKSQSVDVKCSYYGREVSCDSLMRPNTIATAECKQYYRPFFPPQYKKLTCYDSGEWSYSLFQCNPVCGVQGPLAPLIHNGIPTKQGEFPWLTGLYSLNGSQMWEQKCGGTLITPHIVLTAAHCLVNSADNVRLQPSDIKVGLGKYYRDFYRKERDTQISDVKKVVVPRQFAGPASHYALDIGLLDLVVSVNMTAFVLPACVDWNNAFKPATNDVGLVAGWGTTENGVASEVILSAKLNFIGYNECFKMIRAAFQPLLTIDKFCAGSVNSGNQVDHGDSGGGLTFVKDGQHFVIGVVSAKIPNVTSFTLFTDVTNDIISNWLDEEKDKLVRAHRE